MISFNHVGKRFFKKGTPFQALGDAHFDVQPGEFVSVVGPSACGKSTLLNLTAGLIEPSSGSVLYDGEQVTAVNTNVGYVTQADTLLPWRTVRQNIGIPLELRGGERSGNKRDEARRRGSRVLHGNGRAPGYSIPTVR